MDFSVNGGEKPFTLFRLGIDDICYRVSDSLIHTHHTDENLRDSLDTWHYHLPKLGYGLKSLMVALEGVQPPRLAEVTGNPLHTTNSSYNARRADAVRISRIHPPLMEVASTLVRLDLGRAGRVI